MEDQAEDYFWPSYVDLMTSLFFVTLVLFTITYHLYQKENSKLEEKVIEVKKAEEIKATLEELTKDTTLFKYIPEYKRFQLAIDIEFYPRESAIESGSIHSVARTKGQLKRAGRKLKEIIDELIRKKEADNNKFANVSYLLIITGRASKDNYAQNYELSYERSLALYNFWKEEVADFDSPKYQSIIDIQISGVGTGGLGREKKEAKNRSFFIQIVPKIGTL